jgi:transposase
MITYEEFVMIHTLHKQGYSIRAIARMTGLDRRTISKRLKEKELMPRKKVEYKSKLDPFKEYIKERIAAALPHRIPSTVIYREILNKGYKGKIRILQSFMSAIYKEFLPLKEEKVIRFETMPGVQAQVDWTVIKTGKSPIYAFVMILGYSRYAYVHFTDNMRYETFEECHKKAFEFFGGIPKNILYDNLKSVVIQRNAYGATKHKFNKSFLDFSKTYGFTPMLCKPYRAQTKGKVERFIGYLKSNFYIPLRAKLKNSPLKIDCELLNSQIFSWLEITNDRVHGTLKQKPKDLFEIEKKVLLPLILAVEPTKALTTSQSKSNYTSKHRIESIDKECVVYQSSLIEYEKLLKETSYA